MYICATRDEEEEEEKASGIRIESIDVVQHRGSFFDIRIIGDKIH